MANKQAIGGKCKMNEFKRFFDLGNKAYEAGEYEEAVKYFQVARCYAKSDIEKAEVLNKTGWSWRYIGFKKIRDTSESYDKAEAYWKECLKLVSDSGQISLEIKASTVKGLMLIVSKEEAETLCNKYKEEFIQLKRTDLAFALDNSWALRLREEFPKEAISVFRRIYIGAKDYGDFVLAGHAAQNIGAIRIYRDGSDENEFGTDNIVLAEIWFLRALLSYPEESVAHIKNTVEKISKIKGTEYYKANPERDLAVACSKLSQIYLKQGNHEKALEAEIISAKIWHKNKNNNPQNFEDSKNNIKDILGRMNLNWNEELQKILEDNNLL